MSSNIRVNKVCEYCGKDYEARTTTTRYCSSKCNSRAYKALKRGAKIEEVKKQVQNIRSFPLAEINARQLLTVKQACVFTGMGKNTINYWINSGKLPSCNLGIRQTRILREDLERFFKSSVHMVPQKEKQKTAMVILDRDNAYTISEICVKFGVSMSFLRNFCKVNNIEKQAVGRETLIAKTVIDELLKNHIDNKPLINEEIQHERIFDPDECYSIKEVEAIFGLSPSNVYGILLKNRIEKQRYGKSVLVRKRDIDDLYKAYRSRTSREK
ncbi:excisionase family DNA binding protein [Arcticibacter tournemirensis]|uniref:Helix-turn-helix domain-containing protein n=1 Tax=Arcticibacter tournemirensis TaxID=699437 RepID=A0A5M9HEK4_9SPHI|nr:helix-turn-helix domain-containing protein [Arcticibacter tournemirensis]KAA8484939.1 helix-turn-helix domain-containing protein [Arcticibacter tournemirensis]TQM50620.1 excisionase family DNA binding protein [Arcticibacter tournemirensis]